VQQMKEIHADYERLLTAKYTELKLMMPAQDQNREPKLATLASEVKRINNWIEVTTPTLKAMTTRID